MAVNNGIFREIFEFVVVSTIGFIVGTLAAGILIWLIREISR